MITSAIVYVLVFLEYNPHLHQVVSHETVSYHISPTDCINGKRVQNQQYRRESATGKYLCMPVQDPAMAQRLQQPSGVLAPRLNTSPQHRAPQPQYIDK